MDMLKVLVSPPQKWTDINKYWILNCLIIQTCTLLAFARRKYHSHTKVTNILVYEQHQIWRRRKNYFEKTDEISNDDLWRKHTVKEFATHQPKNVRSMENLFSEYFYNFSFRSHCGFCLLNLLWFFSSFCPFVLFFLHLFLQGIHPCLFICIYSYIMSPIWNIVSSVQCDSGHFITHR